MVVLLAIRTDLLLNKDVLEEKTMNYLQRSPTIFHTFAGDDITP